MQARRWMGIGSIALGLGVAAVSLLGPLVTGVIEYHTTADVLNQVRGGDAAALLLVAPVGVLAGILALRGHRAAPALALGPAIFATYTYTQLAVGGEFARYPGNSERFFPMFLALLILGGAIAIGAWTSLDPRRLPATSRRLERGIGWTVLAVALFLVVGLHLPGLLAVWSDEPTAEYLATPTVFWIVKLMDLGLIVPVTVAVGIGLLRGTAWVRRAVYGMVAWLALLGASVAGMAISMQLNDDPSASFGTTIAFSVFAVVFLGLAVRVVRPLFGSAALPTPGVRSLAEQHV